MPRFLFPLLYIQISSHLHVYLAFERVTDEAAEKLTSEKICFLTGKKLKYKKHQGPVRWTRNLQLPVLLTMTKNWENAHNNNRTAWR